MKSIVRPGFQPPVGAARRAHVRFRAFPVRRAFWFLMVLAHAPALVGAWRSLLAGGPNAGQLGGCILLTFSMLFFVLKLGDAAWLRFRAGGRSWLAACIVVALLHTNVLQTKHDPSVVPECTVLVAGTWMIGCRPLIRKAFSKVLTRLAAAIRNRAVAAPTAAARLDAFVPHCWVLAFRVFGVRAPPA